MFSLLIDRRCTVDIIMEAKSRRFSQHFYKSYQTAKVFSCLSFVVYGSVRKKLQDHRISGLSVRHDKL